MGTSESSIISQRKALSVGHVDRFTAKGRKGYDLRPLRRRAGVYFVRETGTSGTE